MRTGVLVAVLALAALGVVVAAILASRPPDWARQPAVILAAGDIADCEGQADETAALILDRPGVVAPLGDLAYPDGSPEDFSECYEPTWGEFKARTRPTMGNHEAFTPGAEGYFEYFGDLAGPEPGGYYSYDLGDWHVVVLNSVCRLAGGCGEGSPQVEWLEADLAATPTGNILAYWHRPRYTTGEKDDATDLQPLWETLAEAGADVVLVSHDHNYQRFAPLDADGRPDPGGIRQFVAGTGGKSLYEFLEEPAGVEFRQNDTYGVLQVELEPCGYRWSFLPVGGGEPLDEGEAEGTC